MSPEHSFGSYVSKENGKKVVKDLTFGNHTPEGVVLTTLDSAARVDQGTSLTIGGDGFGLIAYRDFSGSKLTLKVAHCLNAACTNAHLTAIGVTKKK